MPHPTPESKINQAAAYLRTTIAAGTYPRGHALPPVAALARLAGVSVVTMWKAQRVLRNEGLISGARGQPAHVTHDSPQREESPIPTAQSRPLPHHRIYRELRADILNGVYSPGSALPLMKELRFRHATSFGTLRTVLAHLSNEGLVAPQGKRFAVRLLSRSGASGSVGVIIHRYTLMSFATAFPPAQDVLRLIESHASATGTALKLASYDMRDGRWSVDDPSSLFPKSDKESTMAGYILVAGTDPEDFGDLLALLRATGKPIGIIDQDGRWSSQSSARMPGAFRIFPQGTTPDPGRRVANYLLSLGHRRIAYFTLWQEILWSINRLRGIQEAFADMVCENGVRVFPVAYDQWRPEPVASTEFSASPWTEGQPGLQRENLMIHQNVEEQFRTLYASRQRLQPLMEEALADKEISAWVFANDSLAASAREFLHGKGIAVPDRISVIGFDDAPAATARRITSYNFNLPGIVGAAFRHALSAPVGTRARSVEVPGFIVERETVAAAPQ